MAKFRDANHAREVLLEALAASEARDQGIEIHTSDPDGVVRALRHVAAEAGYAILVKRYPDRVAFKVAPADIVEGGNDE